MTDLVLILFGISMVLISSISRLEGYIKVLAVQGAMLFLLVILDFNRIDILTLIFLSVETMAFKTIIIPIFLIRTVRNNDITREIKPYISSFYSILIVTIIFFFGFFLAYWVKSTGTGIRPLFFGISFSTILTGLFIIISRKKIITHVMGYMLLENGIFMLSLSIAEKMPLAVDLGVFLDVFAAIYLLGLFVNKIRQALDEDHIDSLNKLKD